MKTNWDRQWANESNRDYWNKPDYFVIEFADKYNIGCGDTLLDLGCGIGRHSIYFSQRGANVYAIDESSHAIEKLSVSAADMHLHITTLHCDYLLFEPKIKFDYIIAFNVIYHGNFHHFKQSILKCYDLLMPKGKLLFTCPTRNDAKYGNGKKIDEHTYESENSIHPGDMHYFTSESELKELLYKYSNITIKKEEHYWENRGVMQLASNYIVAAEKS